MSIILSEASLAKSYKQLRQCFGHLSASHTYDQSIQIELMKVRQQIQILDYLYAKIDSTTDDTTSNAVRRREFVAIAARVKHALDALEN